MQRRTETAREPDVTSDPRADELRRRLAESRTLVEERDEFEERDLSVDGAEAPTGDPDARRRHVHEHGRAAVEAMRGAPGG